jgi:hypothetical protein
MNAARDSFGTFAKFAPPLIANGKVYVATWSNQLAVYGLLPTYTVLPTSVPFGNQFVNERSVARLITVTNTANVALPITSITLSGTHPKQFSQTHTCGTSVTVGATCTISVVFKPAASGSRSATLNLNASGGAGTQTVTRTGTGT